MHLHAISNIDLYMQGLHFTRCIQNFQKELCIFRKKFLLDNLYKFRAIFSYSTCIWLMTNNYVIKSFNHAMKFQCLVSIINKINNIPKRHQLLLWPWFHKVDLPLVNIETYFPAFNVYLCYKFQRICFKFDLLNLWNFELHSYKLHWWIVNFLAFSLKFKLSQ